MVYLPDYVEYQYVPAPPLRSLFPMASDDALDLLSKMFTYDPKARISAQQALEHRYFLKHSVKTKNYFLFLSFPLSLIYSLLFHVRYFSSAPLCTDPEKLPRPAPKREQNPHEGPTVLSPPRKTRRVMPGRDGFEGNSLPGDKTDDNVGNSKQSVGNNTDKSEDAPMSLDFSIFGLKPPNRPTITR